LIPLGALETHPALEAVIILLDCRREVRWHRLAEQVEEIALKGLPAGVLQRYA
jgi:hypothetical protein